MTSKQSSLIISNKNIPSQSPTSFRQIENWANGGIWNDVTFAANWTNFSATAQAAQYLIDPFGFVHLRGLLAFNGTLTNGSITTMFTLPKSYSPRMTQTFPALMQAASTTICARVDVDGLTSASPGEVIAVNQTGASSKADPFVSIAGITFQVGI